MQVELANQHIDEIKNNKLDGLINNNIQHQRAKQTPTPDQKYFKVMSYQILF
jgi:hypothetical protein